MPISDMTTCVAFSSLAEALDAFFHAPTKRKSPSHQESLSRNHSLGSIYNASITFPSNDGVAEDHNKSSWEYYLDFPEKIQRRGREFLQKHTARSKGAQPDRVGGSIYHCLGVDEQETTKRDARRKDAWRTSPPSRESSSLSSQSTEKKVVRVPRIPDYLILYRSKEPVMNVEDLDVVWKHNCLDATTNLVHWSGTMEDANPRAPSLCNDNSTLSSCGGDSRQSLPDIGVGWITCFNIQRGLSDAGLASAKDPVLNHFCQRFGILSVKAFQSDPTIIPEQLLNEDLFHPYGTQTAQEEMKHRLSLGHAPDGSVLDLTQILPGMPVFFISDMFVHPAHRGSGLGLVLLDRALKRVADSVCLVIIFLRDYTDERLPHYLGLMGFSYLAPGFLMRRNGFRRRPPQLEDICPFLPDSLLNTADENVYTEV